MSLESIFSLLPKKGEFLNTFTNDNLKQQADSAWQSLDGLTPLLLLIMVIFGIGLAACYYKLYNNLPGRHYKVSHWAVFYIISVALTFFTTLGIEYFCIKTNIKMSDLISVYMLTALKNAIYCAILYLITSVVWCIYFPTNAYRLFKR